MTFLEGHVHDWGVGNTEGPLLPGTHEYGGQKIRVEWFPDRAEVMGLVAQITSSRSLSERVKENLLVISDFILLPIVRDSFDERMPEDPLKAHKTRRAWEMTLPSKLREQLDRNALTLGNIGGVLGLISSFSVYAELPTMRHEFVSFEGKIPGIISRSASVAGNMIEEIPAAYRAASLQKRYELASKVREFVKTVIREYLAAYTARSIRA